MRAPVSVIIPTLGNSGTLLAAVGALFEGLDAGASHRQEVSGGLIRELIISDAGNTPEVARIATETGARLLVGAPGRGGQMHRGAKAAGGAWLLFLHDDTVVGTGWTGAVRRHMATSPDKAAAFHLGFDARGIAPRLVAGWANLRSRLFGLPYGDQGLLIPTALYHEVGGFADIALMEDVAIARRLKGRLLLLEGRVETSAARYRKNGWLRQGAGNIWRLLRYFAGVSPERLARGYHAPTPR